MPGATITPIEIKGRNVATEFEPMYTNVSVEEGGGVVDVSQATYRNMLLLLRSGTNNATIRIKKGTGALASSNDLTFVLHSNHSVALMLESGRFIQTEGEEKGKFVIEGDDAFQICAILFG